MPEPAFRASWSKFAIQGINQSPRRDAIRAVVGERRLKQIRESSTVDWLPVEVHLSVADAILQVNGLIQARGFWRERLLASFTTKAMGPLIAGASFIYGDQLFALTKVAMGAYKLMTRDSGRIVVTRADDGTLVLDFEDTAPGLALSDGWQALCHGQCEALLQRVVVAGDIALSDVRPQGFRYSIRER